MGNEPSKGKSAKPSTSASSVLKNPLKSGPSSSVVHQHLANARKSRVLQLKNQGIKAIPEQLAEVADVLRNLDLSQNKLKSFPPFIGAFVELKQLHLSENLLEYLPDELGELRKLEVLNVSGNRLKDVPKTIVGCSALRTLNLSQNELSSFPVVLCHLYDLDYLNLSQNRITEFPDDIATLRASELVVSQNQLSRINSPALSKCERLKTLRVDENCLAKEQFDRRLLEESNIALISYAGNLFQDKDFQGLPGYESYQQRFTATRRKM